MEQKIRAQIMATIGPGCEDPLVVAEMIENNLTVARLNFSWGDHDSHGSYVGIVRTEAAKQGKTVVMVQDLSGPRVKFDGGHSFDQDIEVITDKDIEDLKFAAKHEVEYVAQSFVKDANDIMRLKKLLSEVGARAKVIAKIERQEAVANIEEIIDVADGIMIARGDLGDTHPIEEIPFIQYDILQSANKKGKPVIVATEMLSSMKENERPTRAEVTDATYALLSGADILMLSDETAVGKHPIKAIKVLDRVISRSEQEEGLLGIHPL